ncbi:MAG: MMPL family transporter, partial [Trebonia sp.]
MSYANATRASHTGRKAGQGPGLLGGLGRACYRHRWITLLTWIIGVACLITLWLQFGAAALNTFNSSDPGQTVLDQHFPRASGDTLTLAVKSTAPVTSPAVKAQVASALVPFERAAHVTSVSDPYTTPGQLSRDGHIAFSTVQFAIAGSSISGGEAAALMKAATAASGHGVTFSLGGDVVDQQETPYGGATEGFGVIAAAVILVIAFGSFLAMGLPIATALLGIGAGLSLIALLGHVFPAPSFSPIIAGLIGLGVGIDYALFIVTRFRESLRAGTAPEAAAVTAMRTAGRSVLVAGVTVVIGMLGLLILRQALLNGVAVAAAATVAMVLLASLTLLPALLGFSGTRLAKPSRIKAPKWMRGTTIRSGKSGRPAAERWAGVIQRHPVIAAALSGAFILVLAAPALGMKLNFPDESAQARGTMGYASYATMAQGFGPGFDAPVIIAATLPDPHASTARLAAAVAATPGIEAVTPVVVSADGQAAMLIAYPATGEQDPATDTLVN